MNYSTSQTLLSVTRELDLMTTTSDPAILSSSLITQNATAVENEVFDNNAFLTIARKPYGGFLKPDAEPYEVYIASVTLLSDLAGGLSTIGNLLTIYVLSQASFASSTASILLRYLAANDLLIALTYFLPLFSERFPDSEFFCRMHEYGTFLFSHLSSAVLIPISLERLVAVYSPLKVKQIFTRARAMVTLLIITVVFASIDLYVPFAFGIVRTPHTTSGFACASLTPTLREYFIRFYLWYDIATYFVAPFFILLVCNVAIVAAIFKQKRISAQLTHTSHYKISSTTWALLGVSLAFLVLVSPRPFTLPFLNPRVLATLPKNKYIVARSALVTIRNMAIFNHYVNFLIYCIAIPKFRHELKKLPSRIACKNTD